MIIIGYRDFGKSGGGELKARIPIFTGFKTIYRDVASPIIRDQGGCGIDGKSGYIVFVLTLIHYQQNVYFH